MSMIQGHGCRPKIKNKIVLYRQTRSYMTDRWFYPPLVEYMKAVGLEEEDTYVLRL